jgi:hypothetical protein
MSFAPPSPHPDGLDLAQFALQNQDDEYGDEDDEERRVYDAY